MAIHCNGGCLALALRHSDLYLRSNQDRTTYGVSPQTFEKSSDRLYIWHKNIMADPRPRDSGFFRWSGRDFLRGGSKKFCLTEASTGSTVGNSFVNDMIAVLPSCTREG